MNIFLTMAGSYERFKKDGFKVPKYLLPWGSETILSKILTNLLNKNINNTYLIANKNDEVYLPHLLDHLKKFNIPRKNLFYINSTSGQAETANLALMLAENLDDYRGKFCIHNIDTILYDRDLNKVQKKIETNDIYIDVFKSNNKDYSYVLVKDKTDLVLDILEKKVISNLASSGMYGFKSYEKFKSLYNKKHLYISEVIKEGIENNQKTCIGDIFNENNTVVLGTPSEYESNSILML